MEKTLSVVIPAYNVEQYIGQCLGSFEDIRALRDMEILVVDDGSTDQTAEIAEKYCRKYPGQYHLFRKENGGHGSAVNYGIRRAEGKYFKVVDGDDWVDKAVLPDFISLLKTLDSDVIASDYNCVQEGTGRILQKRRSAKNSYHYKREWGFAEAVTEPVITIHSMTVKTKILQENPIHLDENCFYEDQEYILYPIPYCTSVYYDPHPLYQYRLGRKGQSVDIQVMQQRRDQHMRVLESLFDYNDRHKEIQTYKKQYLEKGIAEAVDDEYQIFLSMGNKPEVLEEIKAFDERLKTQQPGVYRECPRKSVWLMRKSGFAAFPFGAFAYRLLRGR